MCISREGTPHCTPESRGRLEDSTFRAVAPPRCPSLFSGAESIRGYLAIEAWQSWNLRCQWMEKNQAPPGMSRYIGEVPGISSQPAGAASTCAATCAATCAGRHLNFLKDLKISQPMHAPEAPLLDEPALWLTQGELGEKERTMHWHGIAPSPMSSHHLCISASFVVISPYNIPPLTDIQYSFCALCRDSRPLSHLHA